MILKKPFLSLILILISINNYTQQQQHIPWPSLADSPWPFIRGDMQATGRSKYVGPSTNNVIWSKDMPLGVMYGPVIGYNDILYMGEDALSPDSVNYFYAVNKDGQDFWTFETETFFANSVVPILAKDSTIYFGSRNYSLYALYPNGELKWQIKNILWGWPHCYITLAKNGDLFVPSWDTLVILDKYGIIKEKRTVEGLKGRALIFSTGGDTVFYFTGGGGEFDPGALNAANLNGDFLWSYQFASHNLGTPLVDNANKIYVFGKDLTGNFYLYCIKPDGSLNWKYNVDRYEDYSAPTIDYDGNIILHMIKNPISVNYIVSLDYYGNENWVTQLSGDFFLNIIDHGLVCDAEGKIYCGPSYGGYFYCLGKEGEILWTLDIGEYEYDSSPAIGSDGTLYIGTHISSLFQNHVQNLIAIRDTVTSVKIENPEIISFSLEQNYPNPFNSTTHIKYTIPKSERVVLKIFDALGKEVVTLLDRYQGAGSYDVIFQPKNLSSGIYFYTLTSGNFRDTKKLILLR